MKRRNVPGEGEIDEGGRTSGHLALWSNRTDEHAEIPGAIANT